uniref:Reverse transcriptase domain-containing protein n=1 Tax=Populus alba TaxID=43335 RepID=A0A4U5QPZ4_POPAL|nr:hypothetical protein D5086_0000078400 [Populus alba]
MEDLAHHYRKLAMNLCVFTSVCLAHPRPSFLLTVQSFIVVYVFQLPLMAFSLLRFLKRILERLLKQFNHSIIVLVPKSTNVSSPSDYRPISCCNVIYKVIAKLIAGRLAHALKGIVSPMQNAFLGGRYMSDNINLVQELLRHYGRKRSSPRCLLKVDFKKAFDSVQWDFLASLLRQLGFPAHFVLLVMECVSTASFSVAVNGEEWSQTRRSLISAGLTVDLRECMVQAFGFRLVHDPSFCMGGAAVHFLAVRALICFGCHLVASARKVFYASTWMGMLLAGNFSTWLAESSSSLQAA